MTEKRIRASDRRIELSSSGSTLAIFDCDGGCKKCERRKQPDRRLNNISVDEVERIEYSVMLAENAKK